MIKLSKDKVEEFQSIIEDEFGVTLSYEEAERRGLEVLDLFVLLYGTPEMNERWDQEYRGGHLGPEFPGIHQPT